MDAVFRALGDATRRELLDKLFARDGQTLSQLSRDVSMTRQAVTKHLAQLEAAGLVATRRNGREKHHYLNPMPIRAIAERWIRKYDQPWVSALSELKTALEEDGA